MLLAIIVGGYVFARLMAVTGITESLVGILVQMELGRAGFLFLLVLLYLVLGAMLDVFGMLVLSIPFVMPVVLALGIDPVWFGVFVVIMAEVALVTPPIGANVFVMRRIAPDVPMEDIFWGGGTLRSRGVRGNPPADPLPRARSVASQLDAVGSLPRCHSAHTDNAPVRGYPSARGLVMRPR